jgi:AbrB family looped-hinge helix DNA binding protein
VEAAGVTFCHGLWVAQTCSLGLRLLAWRRAVLPTGAGLEKLPAGPARGVRLHTITKATHLKNTLALPAREIAWRVALVVGYSYRGEHMLAGSKSTAVEYMATTKIGEKGQLTVPKQFREDLGLSSGAPFAVLRIGDGLILVPEEARFERLCERLTGALTRGGAGPETLLAALPKARKRVFARHYGALASEAWERQGRRGRARQ